MAECSAVRSRKKLIDDIYRATGMEPLRNEGSEADLLAAFFMLEGVAAEYTDGGDQMAELCDCAEPQHKHARPQATFDELYAAFKNAVRHHSDLSRRGQ